MNSPVDSPAYEQLRQELRETEVFSTIAAVLSWDHETMMPRQGTPLRAEQITLLSQVVHDRLTSSRFAELLSRSEEDAAGGDAAPDVLANLREIRRDFDRAVRIPTSLVSEMADVATRAQMAWRQAREDSDFQSFAPWLERVVGLNRAKAQCLITPEMSDPYDALLDGYEPGARASDISAIFSGLRERVAPLIRDIAGATRRPDDRINHIRVPIDRQVAFGRRVAERIGFDFDAGRLDISTHPFCQGIGPGDTRLTTRYQEGDCFDALSSTLHEAGHGMYEQNLPKEEKLGEPLGDAASLGIHESQSRLWENIVGRSREFWEWALPEARREFGDALDGVGVDELFGAMNVVQPNLIRVESDEATYNLHILLRYDLERALLSGDLAVPDLPGAWNERIASDLGLQVPNDREGCLQDVHWSMGAIGYFPTYTLGNLYAAQFWVTIREQLSDVDEQISRGEFGELLGWLSREIHRHGRRYPAPELCERVTGRPLSPEPFMHYLEDKLKPLYGL